MAGLREKVLGEVSEDGDCDRDELREMSDREGISEPEHSPQEEEEEVIEKLKEFPSVRRPTPMQTSRGVGEKKVKLRTSKDVYDRLRWDTVSVHVDANVEEGSPLLSVDVEEVYIGYQDRFLGMCEIPFLEFQPGEEGDIPYHRIYYFRTGGPPTDPFVGKNGEVRVREHNLPSKTVFLWDRESRTDLVFHSGDSHPSLRKIKKKTNKPRIAITHEVQNEEQVLSSCSQPSEEISLNSSKNSSSDLNVQNQISIN